MRLARRRLDEVQAGAGHQEILAQRTSRGQFNKVALAKAIVADHGQHITAAFTAAVERAIQCDPLRLQPDGQRLGILHRHDADAQRLQRLPGAELVRVERDARFGLRQRNRRQRHRAVGLGGELLGRQPEAAPRRKEHLPFVAAHVSLEQLPCAKMWMVDRLHFHRPPR